MVSLGHREVKQAQKVGSSVDVCMGASLLSPTQLQEDGMEPAGSSDVGQSLLYRVPLHRPLSRLES